MTFKLHSDLSRDGLWLGDFTLSRLLMINDAAYPWCVLVPRLEGVKDAYELSENQHGQLTVESRALCRAMMAVFRGDKMNVAALGNMTPQLHVHHIVRRAEDPAWPGAVWGHSPLTPMDANEIKTRSAALHKALADEVLAFESATRHKM
ncbi:HIT domain-containing protein [Robiginitomaculum antarcticum]|uniref:HIT domain-containing protein n=1 Tax=Robiginitomaculum antarcticum TaxID=437507 RepID=UPI000360749D|nr:HIT family protein [Robiginitomaculum antarcticum]